MKIECFILTQDISLIALFNNAALEENMIEVILSTTKENLYSLLDKQEAQIIVLDRDLLGNDLFACIDHIQSQKEVCNVLIFDSNPDAEFMYRAFQRNISGYLKKDTSTDELDQILKSLSERIRRIRIDQIHEDAAIAMRSLYLWQLMDVENNVTNTLPFVNKIGRLHFHEGNFRVVLFKLDEIRGRIPAMESGKYYIDIEPVQCKIKMETIKELYACCYEMLFDFRFDGVLAVLNYSPDYEDIIIKKLEIIRRTCAVQSVLDMEMTLTVCVGNSYNDFCKVSQSNREAYHAAWSRLSRGTGKILIYENTPVDFDSVYMQKMEEIMNHLQLLAHSLNSEGIHNEIEELFSLPITILTSKFAKEMIIQTVDYFFNTNNMLLAEHIDTRIEKDRMEKAILFSTSLEDLKELLLDKLDRAMELLMDDMEKRSIRSIRKAIQYIKKNYDQPITSNTLADEVNFNPVYFGHLFKKQTGFTLTEFITDYRLQIAKNLLLETDMRVNEIALATGFGEQRYFCRRFKQLVGVTPTEYRNAE